MGMSTKTLLALLGLMLIAMRKRSKKAGLLPREPAANPLNSISL
ncbi:MAG: hypothetical protein JWR12_2203 [Mucilaginibacter sp.]|nr:hypothetical protein [Mucilaginibacter sp.]